MEEEIIEIEVENEEQEISIDEDVIVVQPNLQEKSVTPKKVVQEVKPDEEYNGLFKVIVEPYEAITRELNVNQNGTYRAVEQGLDGFDVVKVETAGISPAEAYYLEITPTSTGNSQWTRIIKAIPVPITITNGILYHLFDNYPSTAQIPIIDIPNNKVQNAERTFHYATLNKDNIENIGNLDFSECTNFISMFESAKVEGTLSPPQNIDCSNTTNIRSMFAYSNFSGEITLKNTQNVQYFTQLAYNCQNLEGIGVIDCSSAKNISNMLTSCIRIKNLGGFINLGKAYDENFSGSSLNYQLNLSNLSLLTHESAVNVINGLYDLTQKNSSSQVIFHSNVKKQLTDEEIQIATDKGWTIL